MRGQEGGEQLPVSAPAPAACACACACACAWAWAWAACLAAAGSIRLCCCCCGMGARPASWGLCACAGDCNLSLCLTRGVSLGVNGVVPCLFVAALPDGKRGLAALLLPPLPRVPAGSATLCA